MGLDWGTRRIGVALSDPLGLTAQPLTVLERQAEAKDLEAVAALVAEHEAGSVVLGLPLSLRGERGPAAQAAARAAAQLQERLGLPVHLVDERFTTAQSERVLLAADVSRRKRRAVKDQMAAQLILQAYLDRQRPMTSDG